MLLPIVTSFINGLVCMLFFVYGVLLLNKGKERLKTVIGYIMLSLGLFLSKDMVYYFIDPVENLHLYRLLLTIDNSIVVACGIFVLELLRPGSVTMRNLVLHISGFLLLILLYGTTGKPIFFLVNEIYTYIYSSVVFVWLVINTVKYNRMVKKIYADLSSVSISWIWSIVILMLGVLFFWQFLYWRVDYLLDFAYYILLAIVWSVIFFKTSRMVVPEKEVIESVVLADVSQENNSWKYEYIRKQLKQLEQSDFFISSPQLTLLDLANKIGTNRTYLSEYLNKEMRTTFYDYVNNLKLEHAEHLLSLPDTEKKPTLEEVMEQAGFNSLSTFRRAFQKRYGVSPSKYRRTKG